MAKLMINGEEALISERRFASFHGNSIFTTLRTKNKEPLLWRAHWQRLCTHAHYFAYRLPDERRLYEFIKDTLKSCEEDQKVRVIINDQHDYALTIEPFEKPSRLIYEGVLVRYSDQKLHPEFKYFKTGNSLPYQRALKEAKEAGVFESLLLDEQGYVVDGARSSLLYFDGSILYSLAGGLLGIMREEVLIFAENLGVSIERRTFRKESLTNGHLMLANCLLGLVPVGPIRHSLVEKLVNHFRMDS